MAVIAGRSLFELLMAPIVGVLVSELVRRIIDALKARRHSLEHFYWEVSYAAGDTAWTCPESIELVRLSRRGDRVKGTIYSVYGTDGQHRRWIFEGRLICTDSKMCRHPRLI